MANNYKLSLQDVQGGEEVGDTVNEILENFGSLTTLTNVNVISGLNVRTGTIDFDNYALQTEGPNLLRGTLDVYGYTEISNEFCVLSNSTIIGDVSIGSDLYISGESYFTGDVCMEQALMVTEDVSMLSSLEVSHNITCLLYTSPSPRDCQ